MKSIDWTQNTQDRFQELLKIRQKLHSDHFGVVELKMLKLTDEEEILKKERKRLGVPADPRITLEKLGFCAVKNKDNLFRLIRQGKAKVIFFESDGKNFIRMRVQTSTNMSISLQSGTLLLPANDPKNKIQSLIVSNEVRAQFHPGINDLVVKTLCFNVQLKSPNKQQYLLGNIRCISHDPRMNQSKVWEITVKVKQQVRLLQEKLKKQDYIALTEQNIMNLFHQWRRNS